MTKEEIIDSIARLNSETWKDREEVRMEIGKLLAELKKSLEQQPSDDCVSREEVKNKAIQLWNGGGDEDYKFSTFIDYITELPPVTPQRWIPVSERLPKEMETVLVCYQAQGGVAQSVCEWFYMPNRVIVWSTLCGQKPIAWQPLPQPYEEKRGSENDNW